MEGDLVGRCLEMPRAVGNGKTLQELRRNMADVISLVQNSMSEEVPTPLSNIFIRCSANTSQCLPEQQQSLSSYLRHWLQC